MYGTIPLGPSGESVKLCHTGNPDLPDCYRRVTMYKEPLGTLRGKPLPCGVQDIKDPGLEILRGGWGEYMRKYGESLHIPVKVCVTHKRFVPCRKDDGTCVFSEDKADIDHVRIYQDS